MRNITRLLFKSNAADVASTPTGCSAALIDGKTHYRLMNIPVGADFKKVPTNMNVTNREKIEAARMTMSNVVAWFMDEHSMNGREMMVGLVEAPCRGAPPSPDDPSQGNRR